MPERLYGMPLSQLQGTLHQSWSSLLSLIVQHKFFGTNYGLTAKIPASPFKITAGEPNVHEADNSSGHLLHRGSVASVEVVFWSME